MGHLFGRDNITEKQLKDLAQLQAKSPRTDKQELYLQELIAKRDNKELSDGVITHLVDCFASAVYKRREEAFGKTLTKGTEREEDSITLFSLTHKLFFQKNSERLSNDYITGEPDLFVGKSVYEATHIPDIKTSWSLNTFLREKHGPLNKMYYWQAQGYMDLTDAKSAEICYCLVNGTAQAIDDEKRKVLWICGGVENDEYKQYARQIEINHIFDLEAFRKENPMYILDNDVEAWQYDIPAKERIFSFKIERNQQDIDRLHKRIDDCREWMTINLFKKSPVHA